MDDAAIAYLNLFIYGNESVRAYRFSVHVQQPSISVSEQQIIRIIIRE